MFSLIGDEFAPHLLVVIGHCARIFALALFASCPRSAVVLKGARTPSSALSGDGNKELAIAANYEHKKNKNTTNFF